MFYVVKNKQETDSLDLSGQNQDDKLHRWEQIEELLTPGCFYIVYNINTQAFVGLYMDLS